MTTQHPNVDALMRRERMVLYVATNQTNGDQYVGITSGELRKRIAQHKYVASRNPKYKFHSALKKYGFEAFSWEILEQHKTYEELLEAEVLCIARIKPKYNITIGGEGVRGISRCEVWRANQSVAQRAAQRNLGNPFKGRKHTEESRRRMSEALKGRPGPWRGKKRPDVSEKNRARLLATPLRYWLGRARSEETKQKIRDTKKGCAAPPVTELMTKTRMQNCKSGSVKRSKRVICISDGNVFESAASASAHYGFSRTSVNYVALGKRRQVYGLMFKFMDEAIDAVI